MRYIIPILFCVLIKSAALAADEDLAGQARGILRQHCWRCHKGPGSEGGEFDILDLAELKSAELLVGGNPEESRIYSRIVEAEMPPLEIRQRSPIAQEEANTLRRWIAAGAPEFPKRSRRQAIRLGTVFTAIAGDLRNARPEKRPYLRYFTLHHLFNNPVILEPDLQIHRAALSKTINSLSWKRRIALPRGIDLTEASANRKPETLSATVFAVDIRDYGWDRSDAWQEIERRYPYGLNYEFSKDRTLHELEVVIRQLTEAEIPLIRADWFVATATRPPLYHDLLQIPENAAHLESRLKVDIARDFRSPKTERIARAGFARSGVSGQNRLVQRSDALHGYYWKSYDFAPDNGRAKLSRFPLGPRNLFASHPFPRFAFEHDGGEIIFSLPNGLQGYMLVDGKDNRIDIGPVNVVSDPLKTSGTPEIVNGLSCMACHKVGMLSFADSIRVGSATFGEFQQHVQRLHPPQEQMSALVQEDRDQFLRALEACTSPFLLGANRQHDAIENFTEPIGEVARWYRLVFLDLQAVVCELDLADAQQLTDIGETTIKRLGLESLRNGGVISRQEWEAFDRREGPSLMQQTAIELGRTPIRPL